MSLRTSLRTLAACVLCASCAASHGEAYPAEAGGTYVITGRLDTVITGHDFMWQLR